MNQTVEAAKELIGKGYLVTLLEKDGKKYAFKNPCPLSIVDVRFWVARRAFNLGLWLKGTNLCAMDFDSPVALAEGKNVGWIGKAGELVQQTRRGVQVVCRHTLAHPTNRVGFRERMDIIFNNALAVFPAVVGGVQRRWLTEVPPAKDLPILPAEICAELMQKPKMTIPVVIDGHGDDLERALRYVRSDRTRGAVSGEGGHNRTFWLGNRLLQLFPGLTYEQFFDCLCVFNEKCVPPWDVNTELRHKTLECWKNQRT